MGVAAADAAEEEEQVRLLLSCADLVVAKQ
jgi:hypothetical protein